MHRGHDHDHHFSGGGSAPAPHRHGSHTGIGHNHPPSVAQWQTPHLAGKAEPQQAAAAEPDLDQVETAFVEGFATAPDPTSFLRLANVPFEAIAASGERLVLLRVETDNIVDVGSVMPHLGGTTFRYDPLPAKMIDKRRRLRFVYFDGQGLRPLTFAEVRTLAPKA